MQDRRAFLAWLAASPLVAGAGAGWAQTAGDEPLAARAADALDVFDLEKVAHRNVPVAHWGYLMTGVDGEATLAANRDAYSRWQLHTRRLVDLTKLDMGVTLFGTRYASPIVLCPVGSQRAFHPEGELGAARAAKAKDTLQILSTVSSVSVEDIIKARGAPVWQQLYTTSNLDYGIRIAKRAADAGAPAIAVTVDLPLGRNTETMARAARADTRVCASCHGEGGPATTMRPMFAGFDMKDVGTYSPALTWSYIARLKDATKAKILVKGLETGEDAALALKYGCDGIIVSNHGARATETGRATLDCLPEVVAAVKGRIPVLVDGGVRRGTDALKALALGATAVGIGRPYIWGLGAFGQAGVERTLDILNNELRLAMAGVGARSLAEITPKSIVRRA
jgi:isopentenyl diphosphate isomerase/L-lactate dehydrogenase-like FMN-dependent dehydrogenase